MNKVISIFLLLLAIAMNNTIAKADAVVVLHTTEGDIKVRLYDDTPKHRDNFLKLVDEHYYDGLLFHRVIKDFMVQTGDPDSRDADSTKHLGAGSPPYTIEAEINYPRRYNKYGALAAARTGDQVNPERRSSGSQFYIVTGRKFNSPTLDAMAEDALMKNRKEYFNSLVSKHRDDIMALQQAGDTVALENLRQQLIAETEANVKETPMPDAMREDYINLGGAPHLDGAYTVFGEVIEGMDVVEKIQNVATNRYDRPLNDIKIISTERLKDIPSQSNEGK